MRIRLPAQLRFRRPRVREERPHSSSVEVAFFRALGAREHDPQLRAADVLAHHFLPMPYRVGVAVAPLARTVVERLMPGGYGYHVARTKLVDEIVAAETRSGIQQLILLGAGNDTRAYRMPLLSGIRVFELDLPQTQRRKLRILRESGLGVPANVVHIEANFEQVDLETCLLSYGVRRCHSLFLWEGVTPYLSGEAIDAVLASIRKLAGSGSSVLFDYSARRFNEGDYQDMYGGRQLAGWIKKHGVTYRFGLEPSDVAHFLQRRGFHLERHCRPDELERRYLCGSNGEVRRRVWGNHSVVHARVHPGH